MVEGWGGGFFERLVQNLSDRTEVAIQREDI
jgi:hypothetical protein